WSFPVIKRGDVAVDLFMMMSGFLMTFHYLKREMSEPWRRPKTWLRFYIRRFFRIAPLYYLLLFVALWLGPQLFEYRNTVDSYTHAVKQAESRYEDRSFGNIIMHLTFLFGAFPQYSFSTPLPDWSIGLEMQFYAVFPFLMLVFRKFKYFVPVSLTVVGSLLIGDHFLKQTFPMPSFLLLKISFFVIGMLLAIANHRKANDWNLSFSLVLLSWTVVALTHDRLIFVLAGLLTAIIFYDRKADVLRLNKIVIVAEHVLSNRITRWLADMSYAAYLVHLLIMIPLGELFLKSHLYAQAPGSARFALILVCTVIPTYSMAWVLYKFVEQPGILFGKKLINKYV
ncbi:MAG: acyltransferase, partial [Candidatus Omnitrophica bacterium]|nr:acyltransferase [Candidatus Omnitrophota bacterium]